MPLKLLGVMSTTKIGGLALTLLSPLLLFGQDKISRLERATMGLIPYPNSISLGSGEYLLGHKLEFYSPHPDFALASRSLDSLFSRSFPSHRLHPIHRSKPAHIRLLHNPQIEGKEAYRLSISRRGICLEAAHPQGASYAVMTLMQLLESHYDRRRESFAPLERLNIDDSPRYPVRALMLDPARHFLPLEAVKAYIDEMQRYKFNTLQLHLTDDQGWRFEVKSHPRLASPQHYTQEDLRSLLTYAESKGIALVPEIDIPGHTAALLANYPQLRVEAHQDSVFVLGKTDNVMISATEEVSYQLLGDVFAELAKIFPRGTRLHLGGDESAIQRNWAKSPSHRTLMKRLGYHKPEQLMNYFFGRVYDLIRPYGFQLIQWCELDNIRPPAQEYLMDYPQDVCLVTWRMQLSPKCIELTRKSGHHLILAPGESAYLDYPQWQGDLPEANNWGMPITSLERSYNFDLKAGISANKDNEHIIGVMATLWGEAIKDIHRANYMTYPRALAIAEQGWTQHQSRSWERFRRSLPYVLNTLERSGIAHRRPVELYQNTPLDKPRQSN